MKNESNVEHSYNGVIFNGFVMLLVMLLLLLAFVLAIVSAALEFLPPCIAVPVAVISFIAAIIISCGFIIQQPNQARVMIFFGKYRGTILRTGYMWCNPLCSVRKVSLRIRNMDIDPIKVNDKIGNPVLIGMVLVWKVNDTYRAVFDVDASEPEVKVKNGEVSLSSSSAASRDAALNAFVRIQSDAALREVTGRFAYDDTDQLAADELTLRSGGEEINELLESKINERLAMAGISVVEARLNYLAYAPEIAAVMLRRQQASAIITAREKIVDGAVSMVKMAIDKLGDENVVQLDEERKAAMVSNLMVVLCADDAAQPVINTGSLYQ